MTTQDLYIRYLYIATAVTIILLIGLMYQMLKKNETIVRSSYKHYNILVNKKADLIKTNAAETADELERIKQKITDVRAIVSKNYSNEINQVLANLSDFIDSNPTQSYGVLCQLDLRADVLQQKMADYTKGRISQDLLSDIDLQSPEQRLDFMLRNMDVTIALLRNDVCSNGYIDIDALENILTAVNKSIGKPEFENDGQNEITPSDRYEPKLPFYIMDSPAIEPMKSRANINRIQPNMKSFQADSGISFDAEYPTGMEYLRSHYNSSDHYTVNQGRCDGPSDGQLTGNCLGFELDGRRALAGDHQALLGSETPEDFYKRF